MKAVWIAAILALGCSKSEKQASPPTPPPPAPAVAKPAEEADARALIAKGAVVLDVRTTEEFAADHLANATHIPVQDLPTRIAEVDTLVGGDKARPIVVYCGSGKRAEKAKAELERAGYTAVTNGGGLDDVR